MTLSRRGFLQAGGAFLLVGRLDLKPRLLAALSASTGLSSDALTTLAAAADVIVPPGLPFTVDGQTYVEPSGADGFDAYVEGLLDSRGLYMGGPTRDEFATPVRPHPAKRISWEKRNASLRKLFETGAEMLDDVAQQFRRAPFASLAASDREGILRAADAGMLDLYSRPRFGISAEELFAELRAATFESVYGDPAYRGADRESQLAWKRLGYAGDQFVRDPVTGELTGGFTAEELAQPGPRPDSPYGARFGPPETQAMLTAAEAVRETARRVARVVTGGVL